MIAPFASRAFSRRRDSVRLRIAPHEHIAQIAAISGLSLRSNRLLPTEAGGFSRPLLCCLPAPKLRSAVSPRWARQVEDLRSSSLVHRDAALTTQPVSGHSAGESSEIRPMKFAPL